MKIKSIIPIVALLLTFSACKKCVTCVPYSSNGAINVSAQSVYTCSKTDIDAYQSNAVYTSYIGDTIKFVCK